MDRYSHYTWTLTREELTDVWFALTHYADYWRKEAEKTTDAEDRAEYKETARKYEALYGQINRMKRGY